MTTEVQWSELQRDPKGVAALADQGDVRVRRRDGVPLLLVREDSANAGADGAMSAARALRNALAHLPAGSAADVLREEFPWVDLLPDTERRPSPSTSCARWGRRRSSVDGRCSLRCWSSGRPPRRCMPTRLWSRSLTRPLEADMGPVPPPDGA
jgi:hypothetical protein